MPYPKDITGLGRGNVEFIQGLKLFIVLQRNIQMWILPIMFELIIIKLMFFMSWFYLSFSFYIKYVNKFKSDSINFYNPGGIFSISISLYLRYYWYRYLNFIFSLNFLELFIIVFTIHFFISLIFKVFLLFLVDQ